MSDPSPDADPKDPIPEFHPDRTQQAGTNCARLLEKINNIKKRIQRRLGQLRENLQRLPETHPNDNTNGSLSKRGDRRMINEDKALLAAREAEYAAKCTPRNTPCPPGGFLPGIISGGKAAAETGGKAAGGGKAAAGGFLPLFYPWWATPDYDGNGDGIPDGA